MTILCSVVGAALIILAAQDLYHTLFHPAARGDISDWIALRIWRMFRRWLPRKLDFAGPSAFVTVVLFWILGIVLGFALLYYPHIPQSYAFAEGLDPRSYASVSGAAVLSLSSLMTVSTGLYSKQLWLSFLMGTEAVFGFGLLTASISWILSIYPVLEHRKSLAQEATLLHFAEANNIRRLQDVSDSDLQEILLGFASQLTTHRNELSQFPITYFFYEEDRKTSLAGILGYLAEIADESVVRKGAAAIAATILGGAVDDYLKLLCRLFLHREFTNRDQILQAYAEDQNRTLVRRPRIQLDQAA